MKEILDVKLYTMQEFADLLGVTKLTARNYTFKYNLATQTIGRKLYITDRQVRNFLRCKTEGKLK